MSWWLPRRNVVLSGLYISRLTVSRWRWWRMMWSWHNDHNRVRGWRRWMVMATSPWRNYLNFNAWAMMMVWWRWWTTVWRWRRRYHYEIVIPSISKSIDLFFRTFWRLNRNYWFQMYYFVNISLRLSSKIAINNEGCNKTLILLETVDKPATRLPMRYEKQIKYTTW